MLTPRKQSQDMKTVQKDSDITTNFLSIAHNVAWYVTIPLGDD